MKKELKLKTQFNEAIAYLKESKRIILVAAMIFVASGILGLVLRENLYFLNDVIQRVLAQTIGLDGVELTVFILQNNIQSSMFSVLTGILFGVFPIINAILNGGLIGYVLGITLDATGSTMWWKLIPHGIFELPAIIISVGLGIRLGFSLFLHREIRVEEFKRRFYNSANAILMIIIPLLVIAAIIEGLLIAFFP